jgi:hypothetical protein
VADLSLDKEGLQSVIRKNGWRGKVEQPTCAQNIGSKTRGLEDRSSVRSEKRPVRDGFTALAVRPCEMFPVKARHVESLLPKRFINA